MLGATALDRISERLRGFIQAKDIVEKSTRKKIAWARKIANIQRSVKVARMTE